MNKLPKISVITPSYNQGSFIQETIESVLNQKYPYIEYWVIDGGSTDDTLKILKSYGSRVNWISEKDNGQTDAINKGIKKSTGDILCYLNSDDVFLPNAVTYIAKYFITHPQSLWVTGDYRIIDAQGREIQSYVKTYKSFFRNLRWDTLLYILNYISQPSTFWRRSVFKKIGFFDTTLRYCMDYDFWLRLLQIQSPGLIKHDLSAFRIHGMSKGGSQYKQQFDEEQKVIINRVSFFPVLLLHKLHSSAIVLAYRILK